MVQYHGSTLAKFKALSQLTVKWYTDGLVDSQRGDENDWDGFFTAFKKILRKAKLFQKEDMMEITSVLCNNERPYMVQRQYREGSVWNLTIEKRLL